MQIEKLTHEEYCHLLSFGDPNDNNLYDLPDLDNLDQELDWISTLDSTTYAGMTFGYSVVPCMSTQVDT